MPGLGKAQGTQDAGIQAVRERVAAARRSVSESVTDAKGKLDKLKAMMPDIGAAESRQLDEQVQQARNQLQALQTAAKRKVAEEFAARGQRDEEALGSLCVTLAPHTASLAWPKVAAQTASQPSLAQFVSVGEATPQAWPALVPFNAGRGIYLSGETRLAARIALEAVTRIVAGVPARNLAIHVFDPRLTAAFARLSPLRQLRPESFPIPETQAAGLRATLEAILGAASLCAEKVAAAGAASLSGLWESDPLAEGVLHVVVILDYPYAIDAQLHGLLVRVSQLGTASGVQLVIQEAAASEPARDVVPSDLSRLHQRIICNRDDITIEGYDPAIRVLPTNGFDDARVQEVVAARLEASSKPQLPVVPLEEIIAQDIEEPWQHRSLTELRATIGRKGRNGLLTFELRSESPPNASVLIGGAVGQGKSNLLMDIIYSLCCAYGPDELELLLLDFKQGVEFKRFDANSRGENWLPHARVLCLESNQTFGLAVLSYVDNELERRSSAFKQTVLPDGSTGVSSLKAYREATGRPLPRILVVIDEFHRLFEGERENTEAAVGLLENIAKQGRTYGVHLILASQTISGITAMGARKEGIFAQFPVRLSLKNTAAESQAIMSMGNKAASELSFRGEVILNQNTGMDPQNSNERGLSAYADPAVFASVQAQLWRKQHDRPPLMLNGKAFAQVPEQRLADHLCTSMNDEALELWLGQGVTIGIEEHNGRPAVSDVPYRLRLTRNADQGVALIGPDDEHMPVVPSVLASLSASAAAWLKGQEAKVVLLNGEGEAPKPYLNGIMGRLQEDGIGCELVPRSKVREWVLGPLRSRLDSKTQALDARTTLVIALGLQLIAGLDEEFTEGEGFSAPRYSGRTVLQDLASQGAINGVFFIGWWHNLRAAEADMGMRRTALSTYVTVMAGTEDIKSLAGARAQRIEGRPRIGVYDRNGSGGLVEVIPYAMPASLDGASDEARTEGAALEGAQTEGASSEAARTEGGA
ncbi:MAG: hypothetical protein LBG81_09110 [Coriobacteriaceae bacterium]|jgi:hypothetical protein|nr:hypothetical protein [Coriobacteriaceae bacterium]